VTSASVRRRTISVTVRLDLEDQVADDALVALADDLARSTASLLSLLPSALRVLRATGRLTSASSDPPGGPTPRVDGVDDPRDGTLRLRQLLDDLPDELTWDAESRDELGGHTREGDTADYVEGWNDALGYARAIADASRGVLDELEALHRASTDRGVEHLELWHALTPFRGLRRRVYNALTRIGVFTPAVVRSLDAVQLRRIPNLGISSIHKLAKADLVDPAVARDAIEKMRRGM
jgi:hypothetical protein